MARALRLAGRFGGADGRGTELELELELESDALKQVVVAAGLPFSA